MFAGFLGLTLGVIPANSSDVSKAAIQAVGTAVSVDVYSILRSLAVKLLLESIGFTKIPKADASLIAVKVYSEPSC